MPSELSHTEKDKYHVCFHLYVESKIKMSEYH